MKEMTSWHIINLFIKTVKEKSLKAVRKKDIKQIGTLINLKNFNSITLDPNCIEYSGSARHLAP